MMEEPIRKHHDLFPRMFKVFTLYFVITLSVFFGYVQIFGDVKPNVITIPTDDADAENDTLFGQFVEKIAEFENIDTDFDLTLENPDFSLSAQGNVVFDMGMGNMSLDVDLIYNQQNFDVQVSYVSPNVYLSIDDSTYKFDASGDFDLSSLLDFVMNNIEIDPSFIESIEKFLGFDLTDFDPNTLLTKLKIEESQNEENGDITFVIGLGNISARMVCDTEFNIKSIKLKDILVAGNTVKFGANVNRMNKDDVVVEYTETGDEIDMSGITLYTNYAQNMFVNDFVVSNVAISVDDKTYYANVYLDNSNSTKVKVETSLEGIDVSLVYSDNVIYADVASLKLSFNVEDYSVWESTINEIFEKYTSKTVSQIVSDLISQYIGINGENIDVQQVMLQILGGVFDNAESISDYLPSSTEMTENAFSMTWNNGLIINLNSNDNQLTGLNVTFDKVDIDANFEIVENGFEIAGDYYDLSNLLPLSDVVDDILGAEQFGGQAKITIDGFVIDVNYVVDFSNGILAKISTQIFGENISIYINNNQIFFEVGEIVVEGNIDDLENYIARIDSIFGFNLAEQIGNSNVEIDIERLIKRLSEILNELKLVESEGVIALIEYLSNKAYISIDGNNVVLTFENQTISAEAYVGATNETIILPSATDNTDDVLNKIENVKNYIETKQYAFELVVSYEELYLSGAIQIDLKNNTFAIYDVVIGGNKLSIKYADNTAYVDYADLKFKLQTENLMQIFDIINSILKANGMNESVDISSALTEIFGEDVSELSLQEFLALIEIDVAGSLDELKLDLKINSENVVHATGNISFVDDMIDSIDLLVNGKINMTLNVVPFETYEISDAEYYNLTSANKGTVTLSYQKDDEKVDVVANVEIDLTDKIYVKLSTKVLNEKFELTIYNNMLYAQIGKLCFATNFENAKELYDYIVDLFAVTIPEIDIENVLKDVGLNSVNIFDIAGLNIFGDNEKLQVEYVINDNLKVALNLLDEQTIEEISVPEQYEDLKVLLPKIKSLIDYVQRGVFEFDFSLAYNTLTFDGTFKYFDGNFEISNMIAFGENIFVRLQDGTLYFAFGNMKLKFDLTNASTSNVDIFEAINKITSDSFGVVIDFGVFEELLNIINTYTLEDYLNKIDLDISGNSDLINVVISNKKEYSVSKILSAEIGFATNDVKNINLSIYDVIKAQLSLRKTDVSTISEFDDEDYQDYSENFVDGVLDSLRVEDGVYAFNSDIAIRYSNNQFYGELVAMLVESENGVVGNYMPAVSLYTTSLGLNSYIYLIGKDIYVDINGLQVTADLSETTINEIIDFVEQNFGLSLTGNAEILETTTEAFKVILPALDSIYGSWISGDIGGGLQIDINSDLWYAENARFYDIVVQAFVQNLENIIVPTKLVLGANIEDENTEVYDDYSEYWLKDGDVVIEDVATRDLNFAVYLNNISVGRFVNDLGATFIGGENGFKEIVGVRSNYGSSLLTDFNSYKTLLNFVETVYDYAMTYQYGVDVTGTIVSDSSTIEITRGDVYFEVGDLPEGQTTQFEFIEGKSINLQGGFTIINNGSSFSIDLMYESLKSNDIYLTYSLTDTNKFRAKINDSSFEDILRVIQKVLGSQGDDLQDSITQIDQILSSITNLTQVFKEINLKSDEQTGQTILQIKLDIEGNGDCGIVKVVLGEDADGTSKLKKISISDLTIAGNTINLEINVNNSRDEAFDYLAENPADKHIDFSGANELINALVNTSELNYYEIDGSLNINGNLVGININWNVPINVKIKLDEERKPEVMAVIGEIPAVIGINNDVPYEFGDTESGSGRMLYIYYKDGYVYFYRTEYVDIMFGASKRQYEKKLKVSIEEVLSDPLKYVQYGIGFTDMIIEAIQASLDLAKGHTPDLGNVVKSFTANDSQNFSVVLNMAEITNDPKLDTMSIGLSVVNNEATGNKNYIGKATFNMFMPLADIFEMTLESNDLVLKDIGKELDFSALYEFVDSYTYNEGAQWQASNGEWELASETLYKISFKENGGAEFEDIVQAAGTQITLPTYSENLIVNDIENNTKYVYEFAGWYTTETFDENTRFSADTMPRTNTVLYAKWNLIDTIVTHYYTLSFNVNGGNETYGDVSVAENTVFDLSSYVPTKNTEYVDKGYNWVGSNAGKWTYEVTRYTFAGWYTDSNYSQKFDGTMPSENLTLYAKWEATTTTEYYYNWERP